ncbi:MAG: HD domain-containing phosphohydrolase [Nitrospinota bacterium]
MRLSDLAKRGRARKDDEQEERAPRPSSAGESPAEETPWTPPSAAGESPPESAEKEEDAAARAAPPAPEEKPLPLPPEEERISLTQILNTGRASKEAHSPEAETPLQVKLDAEEVERLSTPETGTGAEGVPPISPEEEIPMPFPPDEEAAGPAPASRPAPKTGRRTPKSPPAAAEKTPPASPKPEKASRMDAFRDFAKKAPSEPAPPGIDQEAGQRLHQQLSQTLIELLQGGSKKKKLRINPLLPLVDSMASDEPALEELYRLALAKGGHENALSDHLVHVATFSVKMGKGLRLSEQRLNRLALAALLHDIGICIIPSELRHKKGRLTSQEMNLIRKHPEYGYQIIKASLGNAFLWLAEVIRQEHERENGSGYPQGLSGDSIDEMAKIIGVADVYEALTHDRPHRPRQLQYRAVKEIMEKQKGHFSPRVLKAMLQQLSVFPLNSLVRLNSNAIARVVETHDGQPLRPTVQILFDPKGDYVENGRTISLRENPLLYIVDSVDESELRPY